MTDAPSNVSPFPGTSADDDFPNLDDHFIVLPRRTPGHRAQRQVVVGVGVAVATFVLTGLLALLSQTFLTGQQLALAIVGLLLNAALLGLRKYWTASNDEA